MRAGSTSPPARGQGDGPDRDEPVRRGRFGLLLDELRLVRRSLAASDPALLAAGLRERANGRRWLRPFAWVGHTLDLVVSGMLVLVTHWELVLVEVVPAVWIGAITWSWRAHSLGRLPLPEVHGWVAVAVAVLVLTANLAAYWCNATFAFTVLQAEVDLRAAFRRARGHARIINAWALGVGVVQVVVVVFVATTNRWWFSVALGIVAVLQMYALVALPAAIAGQHKHRSKRTVRERLSLMAMTGAITSVAAAPGFLMNRVALLLVGFGLRWVGLILLAVAVVVQVAGTSSAQAVELATRFKPSSEIDQPTTTSEETA